MKIMEHFIDRYVEVESTDGDLYGGYVVSIDVDKHLLVLRNVKDLKTGELRMNNYHFFKDQIKDVRISDDINVTSSEGKKKKNLHDADLMESMDKSQSGAGALLMDVSDDGPSLLQHQYVDPSLYLNEFKPSTPKDVKLVKPAERLLVDQRNETYDEAIRQIKQQKVISFALEGKRISRNGDVCLLVIATRPMVYFFDIALLPPECLSGDLKAILEDRNILKVVFDVRMMSDCLGSFNIYPVNVFDCQVADLFIYKQKHGQYPTEVPCLADCIQKYLNIRRGLCLFEHEKKKVIQKHERIWLDRPFPEEFIEQCYKQTMFIRELRDPMIRQLLAEFLCGVDIYLEEVRSLPDSAVKFYNSRKIPKPIMNISSGKKLSRKKFGKSNDEYETVEEKQDNLWSTGVNFQEKYHEIHGEYVECVDYGPDLMTKTNPILKTTKRTTDKSPSLNKNPNNTATSDQSQLETSELSMVNNVSESFNNDSFMTTANGDVSSDTYASEWSHLEREQSDYQNDFSNVSDCNTDLSGLNYNFSHLKTGYEKDINENTETLDQKTIPNRRSPDEKERTTDFFSNRPLKKKTYNFKSIQNHDSPHSDSCDDKPKPYDEFQISTSEFESDDSEIFLTSVTDKPRRVGYTATVHTNSTPNSNDQGPSMSHIISDSGKWMINRHLNSGTKPKATPTLASKLRNNTHNHDMDEFPPLTSAKAETNRNTPSPKTLSKKWSPNPNAPVFTRSEPSKSPFHEISFDEIEQRSSQTPEYGGMMNGVHQKPSKQPSGRGKTLQFLAEHSKKYQKKGFLDNGRNRSVPFPPDEELLKVPLVAPMVDNNPILGETVNILKKFPSSTQ